MIINVMAGIDLATAQARLDELLALEASGEKSITFNGRSVTYHDVNQLQQSIEYWNRMVIRLSRGSGVSLSRVVIHD